MEISKNEKEININIHYEEDKYIYEQLIDKEDIKKYIEQLINFNSILIGGYDNIMLLEEQTTNYEKKNQYQDVFWLETEKNKIIEDLTGYIKHICSLIPKEQRKSFIDPTGYIAVPQDGIIDYLQLLNERLLFVNKKLKAKKYELMKRKRGI